MFEDKYDLSLVIYLFVKEIYFIF